MSDDDGKQTNKLTVREVSDDDGKQTNKLTVWEVSDDDGKQTNKQAFGIQRPEHTCTDFIRGTTRHHNTYS